METCSRDFLSDVGQVAAMRAFVCDFCRERWEGDEHVEAISRLELAVQEAAANIVRHAYQGRSDQPIRLVVEADEHSVTVSFFHHGLGFRPGTARPPRFDGTQTGGFGLFLIGECVDEQQYGREADGRRVVRLVKRMRR